MTNLEAVEKALSVELAQANPNEAVVAACGLFKAHCDRKPDPKVYPAEGLTDNEMPWWIK